MAKIRAVYELYGFEAVETPFVEFTEALGKFLPDQDRPNEGVFSFQRRRRAMAVAALRPHRAARALCRRELRKTAQALSQLPRRLGVPQREAGPGAVPPVHAVRRRHGRGGVAAADAEMCMMAADCLEALGIKRGDYVIKVNNRKVLDGVMEAIGLGGVENAARRLTVLRAIDKLDRLGPDGVARCSARVEGRERRLHQGAGLDRRASRQSMRFWHFQLSARLELGEIDRACLADVMFDAWLGRSASEGLDELREIAGYLRRCWLWRRPHPHRPLRRPRPRILHRPGL